MWRIWHNLFGWHYVRIQIKSSYHKWFVFRVEADGDGNPYCIDYSNDEYYDLREIDNLEEKSYGLSNVKFVPLTFPRKDIYCKWY